MGKSDINYHRRNHGCRRLVKSIRRLLREAHPDKGATGEYFAIDCILRSTDGPSAWIADKSSVTPTVCAGIWTRVIAKVAVSSTLQVI